MIEETDATFEVHTLDDLREQVGIQWLIKDMIPRQGLAVLFGESGTGKTFTALDWAMQLAHDNPTKSVLYIGAEGETGYPNRVNAWYAYNKRPRLANVYFILQSINLLDPTVLQRLLATVYSIHDDLEQRMLLIVVDTLAQCFYGDENASGDMGTFIRACNTLRFETGATVLVLHHPNSASNLRGSTSLKNASDVVIKLTNTDGRITLTCTKMKDAPYFSARSLRLVPVPEARSCVAVSEKQSLITKQVADLTDAQRVIYGTLSETGDTDEGLTAAQIAEFTELPERTVWQALSVLKGKNLIRQEAKGAPYMLA